MAVMFIHKLCLWDETVLLFCGRLELFSVWTLQLVGTDGGGSLKMSDVTVLHMNYFRSVSALGGKVQRVTERTRLLETMNIQLPLH